MEGREPDGPVLRPIGVVRTDPHADVVIQARSAPVTRGVVEFDPALSPPSMVSTASTGPGS
jgi:hypothetical protein